MKKLLLVRNTNRDVRVPPGQREIKKWPVLQAVGCLKIDLTKWNF